METKTVRKVYVSPRIDVYWLSAPIVLQSASVTNDGYGEPINEGDPGGWH